MLINNYYFYFTNLSTYLIINKNIYLSYGFCIEAGIYLTKSGFALIMYLVILKINIKLVNKNKILRIIGFVTISLSIKPSSY